ncbi:MAG: hypothetical protein GX446_08490 [Chthonomonadales bacterium]|nr:hypothetical protein [Chthonomonadales bacterium]
MTGGGIWPMAGVPAAPTRGGALALALIAVLLSGPALPVSAQPSRALLRNGGFERDGGWNLGQYTVLDTQSARTGKRCLRAEGDRGASAEQTVWTVRAGGTYTVSGWMRTDRVVPQPNGFAYMALYEHDASGRIVRFTDFAKVTGTTEWHERRHTTTLAPATEYVVVKAGIHSALGTAWFDDINLVEGAAAIPWTEPANPAPSRTRYTAAILDEPGLPVVGAHTPAETILRACAAVGMPARKLSAAQISGGALTPERFDLLVIPTGAAFPVECRKALIAFVMAGGDLLCTGGYAFDHLVVRANGWEPYRVYLDRLVAGARDRLISNGDFEEGTARWEADGAACVLDDGISTSGKHSARVRIEQLGEGQRWSRTLDIEPGRAYLIGAKAKCENVHGSHYAFLAVYQYDEAGKLLEFKDFAQFTGTQDWTRHESRIVIHPSAKRVLFHAGLYLAAGTLWFDDVTCAPLPVEERINAHFGEPGDALIITPAQLTLFSPDQPLQAARGVGVWPGWSGLSVPGPLRGYDATAQLRQSARWQPLVEARDEHGRMTGAVGSLVTFGSGPFAGSRWALFGVTNRDIFAGRQGGDLLRRTLRVLAEEVAARSLTTDFAMYDRGETARIALDLHSPRGLARVGAAADRPAGDGRAAGHGAAAGSVRVTLTLDAPGRSARSIHVESRSLKPGVSLPATLNFAWKVPANAPDFVRARAAVTDLSGRVLDTIETGFCVRDHRVVASGTRIRYRDNAFDLQRPGKPAARTTVFGTDTYGNMLLSPSCSPLTWYRDMQAMRDHGLHMFENLQYPPKDWKYTEAEWRKMDAMIQLAQRFGLPYMAGLLIGVDVAVDDATLQAQAAMCRSFAERYRHVPGLIYYLNGDFQLHMKDIPDLRRLWNGMLAQRYGSDAALKAAWGSEAVAERLGDIPVVEFASASAFSERARDTRLFQAMLVERWVSALTKAIREVDTDHPITSEYYQRPYSGIDLRLSMDGMDAANIGYFGPPRRDIAELLATIKWNDMRRHGKTVNLGEFGVKTHDAWAQERDGFGYHTGRTEEEQRRQLWWIVHAALAYDVTKIQNWCWSDDPDGVFPWGVAYNNPLRPKPALRLWRNLRYVSDLMPHAYEPAQTLFVMPDSWRLGAPEPAAWTGIASALECLLATNVRFDVANEADLSSAARAQAPSGMAGQSEGGGQTPRLIIAPFASRMSDAAQQALLRCAEAGATVYVSGLPSVGPIASVMPASSVAGALTRITRGRGQLIVAADTWEPLPGHDVFVLHPEAASDPTMNRYLEVVRLAGVEPDAIVEAPSSVWRAATRQADGRTLIALFARSERQSPEPVTVRASGRTVRWSAAGNWPCLVVLNKDGGVLAATGSGMLSVDGRAVASGNGPWLMASLDGHPIERSRRVVISMTNGGTLDVRCATPPVKAAIVERQGDTLRRVGSVAARSGHLGPSLHLGPNDLVLVEIETK